MNPQQKKVLEGINRDERNAFILNALIMAAAFWLLCKDYDYNFFAVPILIFEIFILGLGIPAWYQEKRYEQNVWRK